MTSKSVTKADPTHKSTRLHAIQTFGQTGGQLLSVTIKQRNKNEPEHACTSGGIYVACINCCLYTLYLLVELNLVFTGGVYEPCIYWRSL